MFRKVLSRLDSVPLVEDLLLKYFPNFQIQALAAKTETYLAYVIYSSQHQRNVKTGRREENKKRGRS